MLDKALKAIQVAVGSPVASPAAGAGTDAHEGEHRTTSTTTSDPHAKPIDLRQSHSIPLPASDSGHPGHTNQGDLRTSGQRPLSHSSNHLSPLKKEKTSDDDLPQGDEAKTNARNRWAGLSNSFRHKRPASPQTKHANEEEGEKRPVNNSGRGNFLSNSFSSLRKSGNLKPAHKSR